MNAIIAIHPYKYEGLWVFDDAKAGLVQEPFVSGADEIIDRMVQNIPDAAKGFTLLFSAGPLPGHQATFEWRRADLGGNWYYSPELGIEGWLCPALFRYFALLRSESMRNSRRRLPNKPLQPTSGGRAELS